MSEAMTSAVRPMSSAGRSAKLGHYAEAVDKVLVCFAPARDGLKLQDSEAMFTSAPRSSKSSIMLIRPGSGRSKPFHLENPVSLTWGLCTQNQTVWVLPTLKFNAN